MLTNEESQEIEQARNNYVPTLRKTVQEAEDILYTAFPVLDWGFVRVVDYMGSDSAVVQAARMSYGEGTKSVSDDVGLIRYLMRHRHTTPFEMCEIKLHIKLPIFVMRQWIRHRTASVNEYSARYSLMKNEFYIPELDRVLGQSTTNKQGSGGELPMDEKEAFIRMVTDISTLAFDDYETACKAGVSREMARIHLPLNTYTECYWKIDLHNLLHFLSLRADSHAQFEIRTYADTILDIVRQWVPHSHKAFMDYKHHGASLSDGQITILQDIIRYGNGNLPADCTLETYGLSEREWKETQELFGL